MFLNSLRTKFNFASKIKHINAEVPKRQFWNWLNHVWNNYDPKRVEEVGANRACTEWLMKCGAHVKFVNWGSYCNDYNKIPPGGFEAFKIEEIRAENACIMARGFEHLNGLKNVKKVKLINCELVDDAALAKLSYLRNSLEELQLVFCPSVTDFGLSYLYLLTNLKDLYLNYLPKVKDPETAVKLLREKLPNCRVKYEIKTKDDEEKEEK